MTTKTSSAVTLYLVGHSFRFALEESVVAQFGMKPDATIVANTPPRPADGQIISHLSVSPHGLITATAVVRFGGHRAAGMSRVRTDGQSEYDAHRTVSHALKIALAKAAARFGGAESPWGSLSGMRPSKLAMRLIAERGAAGARDALIKRYLVLPDRASLVTACAEHGLALKRKLNPGDIAVYIGIPFCPSRCVYCSFVSASTAREGHLIEPYLDALMLEITERGAASREAGGRVTSLYIGGGTPTVLDAPQLARLMRSVEASFDLASLREYTVEAGRPDTITAAKLDAIRAGGATRVSVNPQSMNAEVLALAGRPHTPNDVLRAFDLARARGFTINMDIIAGLAGDSPDTFAASLERILALEAENITVHTLAKKRSSDAAQTHDASPIPLMLDYSFAALPRCGYAPYYIYRQKYTSAPGTPTVGENTGWTRDGFACEYNIASMEEIQPITALGAGGISKLIDGAVIHRESNPKYVREYIQGRNPNHGI